MGKIINLIGRKFGRLEVIEKATKNNNGRTRWLCKCSCDNIKIINSKELLNGNTISCGCYRIEQLHKRNYKGTKDISKTYFNDLKNCAKRRGLEFNIIIEEIQELLEKQEYICDLSGLFIKGSACNKRKCSTYSEQTASLDRIDSNKGYTIDNVRWVHKDINRFKNNYTDEKFLEMCTQVVNHRKKSRIVRSYKV